MAVLWETNSESSTDFQHLPDFKVFFKTEVFNLSLPEMSFSPLLSPFCGFLVFLWLCNFCCSSAPVIWLLGLVAPGSCSDLRCFLPAAAVGVLERNFFEVFSTSTWDASRHHTLWAFSQGFVQAESNSQVKFRQ